MEIVKAVERNVEKVIIGKNSVVKNILKGILAGGHILIEDIPGIGKTTLVKALAKSLNLSYSRIQFTPDLLPSDILGVSIYNQKEMTFEFRKGPVFAHIVLADEINRTSPKTQAALLEAMEEHQVSEGGAIYPLEAPFFVMATQNPIEYEGTFNLPEAQLDRFMMRIRIGYPSLDDEVTILKRVREELPLNHIGPVADLSDVLRLQEMTRKINVADPIYQYIVNIVKETRESKLFTLGASPRASIALMRVSQATALMKGRDFVIPEDVKENVGMVLSHRLILSSYARGQGSSAYEALQIMVSTVEPPRMDL
ncbi:MoxR family ATPase [Proteiniclasticum sp. BAD-10]|uniref:MoxR family ATPase n=1 Tax=Proteiniclasticum sediminis TaxID=2804028 RepID=A0A941HQ74_9CLOT|nr:MoxR family ATPase [Proteiniclasticum sediminis]MBR0576161.1 MoxR family ATPase [Proteiniclasticum sediminis]